MNEVDVLDSYGLSCWEPDSTNFYSGMFDYCHRFYMPHWHLSKHRHNAIKRKTKGKHR